MQKIRLYVDHPKIGCGFRPFLVLGAGPRWARLICTDTAIAIKVPVTDLKWAKSMQLKPTRAGRRLRAVARDYAINSKALHEASTMLRAG